MKKIVLMAAAVSVFAACNGGGEGQGGDTDTGGVNAPGIENVNGTIPDTSNAIKLSTSDTTSNREVDSSRVNKTDTGNRKK